MSASRHQPWLRAVLLVGVAYFLIGRLFALPASHVRAWRLAAWLVSGAVYAAHIGYEHFALRNSPRPLAAHAALAAAIGAFGLAVAGLVHSLWAASGFRATWLLALLLWPAVTAVPALLLALVAAVVVSRLRRT